MSEIPTLIDERHVRYVDQHTRAEPDDLDPQALSAARGVRATVSPPSTSLPRL